MYFKTPSYSVAFNAKVASSTLSRAIIKDFYPEKEAKLQTAAYPKGVDADSVQSQFFCPKEKEATQPIVLIIRDPVDRFCSAMAQLKLTDVDQAILSLQTGCLIYSDRIKKEIILSKNVHFKHQYLLANPSAKVFKLEDLDTAANYIGLTLPLPLINEAVGIKPILTQDQENQILSYYAIDKELYDSVPSDGLDYNASNIVEE